MNTTNPNYQSVLQYKVADSLISHVFQQTYIGQFTSLFCASVIMIALYNTHTGNSLLLGWYMFFIGVVLFRIVLAKLYSLRLHYSPELKWWKYLLIFSAMLGGLSWGLTGSLLFAHANSQQQTLIILILAGITAGASPILAAEIVSAIVFLSTALLPLLFQLAYYGDNTVYSLFFITAIAYYIYLIVVSVKLHHTFKDSITLKFENDILLQSLSHAKHQLEISNKNLVRVATHDPLTQIANRSLFETSLTDAIKQAEEKNTILALFYIDLDNFKDVNDAYGHHVGDLLLQRLVERLRKNIRSTDLISRLGGDELTVLLENINDADIIFSIANVLCNEVSKPFVIQDITLNITASIGVSIYPLDGKDSESLLRSADTSMYYVKEHGRNNCHFSDQVTQKREMLDKIIKSRSNIIY